MQKFLYVLKDSINVLGQPICSHSVQYSKSDVSHGIKDCHIRSFKCPPGSKYLGQDGEIIKKSWLSLREKPTRFNIIEISKNLFQRCPFSFKCEVVKYNIGISAQLILITEVLL